MNCFLVIGAVIVAAVSSSPVSPCLNDLDTISKCLSDNGLSMADFTNLGNSMAFDEQIIKKQCSQYPQYIKAYTCVVDEFNRCSLSDAQLPSNLIGQISQEMNVLCNDTKLNFDCLAQAQQQSAQIQACVEAQSTSLDSATHTTQENNCESFKIGAKCVVDLVTKCDAHTGGVMGMLAKVGVGNVCSDAVVG